MGILSWLRNALSGPPRIDYGSGDQAAEAEIAIGEEMPVAAEDEARLEHVQAPEASRPGVYEPDPGTAAFGEDESGDAAPDSHA